MSQFSNQPLSIDDMAQVASVQWSELHPAYRWVNLVPTVTFLLLTTTAIGVFLLFINKVSVSNWLWAALVIVPLVISLLSFVQTKVCRYAIREHDILFQQGLFWQQTTAVAFNRIQHIDLTHGPLERKYAIATLKFFTAGGSSVDLKIAGLPEQHAKRIRAMILAQINQEAPKSVSVTPSTVKQ